MKTLSLSVTLLILSFFGYSQNEDGISITITIDNVLNDNGVLLLGLHSENTFMKSQGLMTKKVAIEDRKITVKFNNVRPGEYAIMALHDENENNRMDFEPNGMPKEAYGMSNNPMSFGPPLFNDAKFEVSNKDLNINIRF